MFRIFVVSVVAVLMVFGPLAQSASAKSFVIERMVVEATLNSDASMDVVEHLTYDFRGSFSQGVRPIPDGDYEIVNMQVSENGRLLAISGAPNDLRWSFSATDEKRTFDISYRVLDVAKVGPDVGELYWKFMGDEHQGFGTVDVTLNVPSLTGVRAWGHGPLYGTVELRRNVVRFEVRPLPANTFMEGRVTVPASAFTVASKGGDRLPGILKQEGDNADAANAQRNFSEAPTPERHPRLFNALSCMAIVVALALHLLIWRKWGREPKRPEDVGKYWYEPPDVAPATVIATLGSGDGFAGTIVDLAQRGHMRIEEFQDTSNVLKKLFGGTRDWRLIRQNAESTEALLPFERRMLEYLFEDGDQTTQGELRKRAEKHPTAAKAFMDGFKAEVKATVDGVYWAKGTGKAMVLNLFVGAALLAFGIWSIIETGYVGIAAIVVAIIVMILTVNLSRRTELGARKAAEWQALRSYLKDFSNFEDAPIGHMILWERFLVFGVAFGVAEQLARGLQARVPEVDDQKNGFASWYSGASGVHTVGRIAALGAFSGGAAGAMGPPSSGSGSGGGFSGGGGGGGGGGGAGAS
jgi:uncharacterized membrane protein